MALPDDDYKNVSETEIEPIPLVVSKVYRIFFFFFDHLLYFSLFYGIDETHTLKQT